MHESALCIRGVHPVMDIIIRKDSTKRLSGSSSQYQNFTPHLNHAIDKRPIWIGTRQQYDRELKSRGLEVFNPDKPEAKPKLKEHKVSRETRKVVEAIKNQTDRQGNFNPSGSLQKELIKRKTIRKHLEINKLKESMPTSHNGDGGFK